MSNNEHSPDKERTKKDMERINLAVLEITEIANFLGTKDMHLAGIIYLASIVRRRKRKPFTGVEVHRGGNS